MLSDLFGQSALVRVLDFLLDEWDTVFTKADVAKEGRISYTSVNYVWKPLEKLGLVELYREIGGAKLYKVNTESKVFKALKELDKAILEELTKN